MILGKYKKRKTLGSGAYGQVFLVKDPNQKQFAIKTISKASFSDEPYLQEYLDGEIKCMMELDSPYIMKLYDSKDDDDFKYLICEYCDGGDLLNYQAQQSNKVFTLDVATEIMAQIVKGLQFVHSKNYIHRDIKSQNILVKSLPNNEKQFKLADFGFAKKLGEVNGTILGTEPFMAPEIFDSDEYEFGVDIWALGVLFFFMLNMEFPFKFKNPHAQNEEKRDEVRKQAEKFSYQKLVKKSKKKLMVNCTSEVEDFFTKIFQVNTEERLDFVQLREHPLFKKHFPVIQKSSRLMYKTKKPIPIIPQDPQKKKNLPPSSIMDVEFQKRYVQEKQFLELMFSRVMLISEFEEEIENNVNYFGETEMICLRFCLQKYHCILLEKFIHEDIKPANLKTKRQKLKWDDFVDTKQYLNNVQHYRQELKNSLSRLQKSKKDLDLHSNSIKSNNKYYTKRISDTTSSSDGYIEEFAAFSRECLRISYYNIRVKYISERKNKFMELMTIFTVCFAYRNLLEASDQELKKNLKPYFEHQSSNAYNFKNLKKWIWLANKEDMKEIIMTIIKSYFDQ